MRERKESTSPRVTLALVWGVSLFFTLYGATQIRDELGWDWLARIVDASESIGMSALHDGLEVVRSRINDDYLVLEAAPQVAAGPSRGVAHHSVQATSVSSGSSAKPWQAGVGFQVPSTSWQGVMSTPEFSSIHGTALWISVYVSPPAPHGGPPDTVANACQLPSGYCT